MTPEALAVAISLYALADANRRLAQANQALALAEDEIALLNARSKEAPAP